MGNCGPRLYHEIFRIKPINELHGKVTSYCEDRFLHYQLNLLWTGDAAENILEVTKL